MAYRKLLYNDDCILDIESNKVIFDFDKDWVNYKTWASDNPKLEEEIINDRTKLLNWNQGKEVIKDGIRHLYHISNGEIYKKEYLNDSGEIYKVEEFYEDGVLANIHEYFKEHTYQEVFTKIGEKVSELNIKKESPFIHTEGTYYFPDGGIFKSEYVIYNELTKHTEVVYRKQFQNNHLIYHVKTIGDNKVAIKYTLDGDKHSVTRTHKGKDESYRKYWLGTSKVIVEYITTEDNQIKFTEYYSDGVVRSSGTLNLKRQMIGDWSFFHKNGNLESEHNFDKGRLIEKSFVYFEDGTLNDTYLHD